MLVTGLELMDWRPGSQVQMLEATASEPRLDAAPVTSEQRFHLDGQQDGQPGWLAVVVQVPDQGDISAAVEQLLAAQQELRTGYRTSTHGQWQRWIAPQAQVASGGQQELVGADAAARAANLAQLIDERARAWPPAANAALVITDESSTRLLFAADHSHVDAVSMAIIAGLLLTALNGTHSDVATESYSQAVVRHQQRDSALAEAEVAAGARAWADYFTASTRALGAQVPAGAGTLSHLPADLGLLPGQTTARVVLAGPVLDDASAEDLRTAARAAGATLAGTLIAGSVLALDGYLFQPGQELPLMVPVHSRDSELSQSAVGWFVRNAPVIVPAREPGESMLALAARLRPVLAQGRRNAWMPLEQMLGRFTPGLSHPRRDIFMMSVVDYRVVPTAPLIERWHGAQVSASSPCDDFQLWWVRTHAGLAVRVRHPDTTQAHKLVAGWLERVTALLQEAARAAVTEPHGR